MRVATRVRTTHLMAGMLALSLVVSFLRSDAASAIASAAEAPSVAVVELRVDGRSGPLLGIDNPQPSFGWRMVETPNAVQHPCYLPAGGACPGDAQTAFQIQVADATAGFDSADMLWDSGVVASPEQIGITYQGTELRSRQQVLWRVRVWDADGRPSDWSSPGSWQMGLLSESDWGAARWIEHVVSAPTNPSPLPLPIPLPITLPSVGGSTAPQPLPIFARAFEVEGSRTIDSARLYLSGVGLHLATVNGQRLSEEVLAPGNSNYQLSSEYRTYDLAPVLRAGENVVGVQMGHGPAFVRREANSAAGRTSPYSWWQSQLKGSGTLAAEAAAGQTTVRVDTVTGYHVGGTINIDTGDGGERLESRVITAIGTAGVAGTGITFEPAIGSNHASGARVTGSGNNVAASDASAGAAVTPRLIGRLEITYTDGTTDSIVTDRSWRSAPGPYVTAAWYSGADFDARRVQEGWDEHDADLSDSAVRRDGSPTGWQSAGIAPPPNLATRLVARAAEPVVVIDEFVPKSITSPQPGTWVFDFGQNFSGIPQLRLDGPVAAGTMVRMRPAESLSATGTVDQASIMGGGSSRGTDVFNTYTTYGDPDGETWRPEFGYFGMQWVQVEGLPAGYVPDETTVTGLQVMAGVPEVGQVTTSNERINRIHRMARYSMMSNMMSTFTDCPGREKLSYPADYTMPMGMIHRNFDLAAYMRTTMLTLVEGQSRANTTMRGNVALKTPVYDWGYTGQFGDEINWGNGIILVPWFLYQYYGDTQTMTGYYAQMTDFVDYIRRQKIGTGADQHIVTAALADWASAQATSGAITGTWGYYVMIDHMAEMASLTGHDADAAKYRQLAQDIKDAFNSHFFNDSLGRYTSAGNAGTAGATQAAQALALDAGLVPDSKRDGVLDALVELVYAYQPNGGGPHFSAGTIGMAPVVRALADGGRDDVLWDLLQEDTQPSYGYFMASTTANPGGLTTVGERWTLGDSKNHMILAQIEEWFHTGLAGIRAADGSLAYRELVIQPKVVGDLTAVSGSYTTAQGKVSSSWTLEGDTFELAVTIPPNTVAEIWVPTDGEPVTASGRAVFDRIDGDYAVYDVGSGSFTFTS